MLYGNQNLEPLEIPDQAQVLQLQILVKRSKKWKANEKKYTSKVINLRRWRLLDGLQPSPDAEDYRTMMVLTWKLNE